MNILFWGVSILGALYSFGHAFYLWKDKNKLGAFAISMVAISIVFTSFFVRLK